MGASIDILWLSRMGVLYSYFALWQFDALLSPNPLPYLVQPLVVLIRPCGTTAPGWSEYWLAKLTKIDRSGMIEQGSDTEISSLSLAPQQLMMMRRRRRRRRGLGLDSLAFIVKDLAIVLRTGALETRS
jgi:hypothetical protein